MIRTRIIYTGFTGLFLAVAALSANAQNSISPNSDNTAVNVRDRTSGEPTADQATNSKSDRELMQKIRRAIVGNKSLSTYAHNVKVISENGNITLKGPVQSEEERQKVLQCVTSVAG